MSHKKYFLISLGLVVCLYGVLELYNSFEYQNYFINGCDQRAIGVISYKGKSGGNISSYEVTFLDSKNNTHIITNKNNIGPFLQLGDSLKVAYNINEPNNGIIIKDKEINWPIKGTSMIIIAGLIIILLGFILPVSMLGNFP